MRSFVEFVAAARAVVEAQALEHVDDRWWILEPLLIVERRELHTVALAESPHALRALRAADLAGLPASLAARRAAVALHADLSLDGELTPAIVLAVAGSLAVAVEHARVLRTDAGTPILGAWEPSDLDEAAVAIAAHGALR
jgi:predicted outer membrane lipoprotein